MKCFSCGKKLRPNPNVADTKDGQFVFVGSECFKEIKRSGEIGYQPPKGGPRLYVIPAGLSQQEIGDIRKGAYKF